MDHERPITATTLSLLQAPLKLRPHGPRLRNDVLCAEWDVEPYTLTDYNLMAQYRWDYFGLLLLF